MAKGKKDGLSKLAVRMQEDLVLSGKSPKTVTAYLRAVRQLAVFYNRSPDHISEAQVRTYLVHLTVKKNWPPARSGRLSAV